MTTKPIRGNELQAQTNVRISFAFSLNYEWMQHIYLCTIRSPNYEWTNPVPFASPNYEWTMFTNISYTIRFSPNYEWLPQIQTVHISQITTFTFAFICLFTHTYSLYDKSHVTQAYIIKEPICAQGTHTISYRET